MTQLRLFLLGPPEVWYGEQALTFATRKALALLIYLVVEKGLQPREKLQTLFWPDSDPGRGRGALRTTLAYLRRTLASAAMMEKEEYLLAEPDTLGFNFAADFELDLQWIEQAGQSPSISRLEKSLGLYRGDFLEGFSLPDAPAFDEWATIQRERWHLQLNQCFDRLSQMQAEGRQFEAGIATATRWVAHDRLNEAAYRRLIQLYSISGNRAAALQSYANCQRLLETELGVAPSPETKALAEQIRRMKEGSPVAALAYRPPVERVPLGELPFVGRSAEHARLAEAYQAARQGQAQLVVIEGEAGIGKSRLAGEFLTWLSLQGVDCLRGLAFEAGGRLPYQPVVDALRERIERENAPDDLLSDVWLAELSRLLPELRDRYPELPPPTGDESLARTRLLEAVVRLGLALAQRRSVVIFIDDIQWADAASLDLLHYTSRRWAESNTRLLLLLNLRSEALLTTPALGEWLTSLGRHLPLTRLALGPITAEDTSELVASLVKGEGGQGSRGAGEQGKSKIKNQKSKIEGGVFAHWLFTETAGQPFFIAETIKALVEREVLSFRPDSQAGLALDLAQVRFEAPLIPPGVRQVILARLSRLSPGAMALLTAAAVIGRNCSFERLGQVAGLAEIEGLPALDELLAGRLLLETSDLVRPYRIIHDKIRDVVYTEAGDARRRIFHRRAFESLAERASPAAELAHHALAARLGEAAGRYSLAAGDEAMAVFAVRDALAYYEQTQRLVGGEDSLQPGQGASLELAPLASNHFLISNLQHLYLQLGRVYELTNQWDKARASYEVMLSLAQQLQLPQAACAALNRLATLAGQIDYDIEKAMRLLQQAVQVAQDSADPVGLAETEWNLAQLTAYTFDVKASYLHAERSLALARQAALPELTARSLTVVGFAEIGLARWEEAQAHYEEAGHLYATFGNRAMEAECLCGLVRAGINLGYPRAALEPAQIAHRLNLESDNEWGQAVSAFHLGFALLEQGELGEALAVMLGSLEVALKLSDFAPLPVLNLTVLGDIYRAMLALDEAQAAHRQAHAISESRPYQPLLRMTAAELCADYALAGEWDTAYRYARQSLGATNHSLLHGGLQHWTVTEALLRGGEAELAQADLQRFNQQFAHSRRYQIPQQRCLAVLTFFASNEQQKLTAGRGSQTSSPEAARLREAIAHLEAADALAGEIGLPNEQWPILARLGELYQAAGDEARGCATLARAAEIIEALAAKIDDVALRARFLEAGAVTLQTG